MKIKKEALEKIIQECVSAKIRELSENQKIAPGVLQEINWGSMKYLHGRGKLHGKWHILMTAFIESNEDEEAALRMLKMAVATIEASRQRKEDEKTEMASIEDLTDFSKLL